MSLTAQSVTAFTSSTCRWDLFYNSSFIISCWEFYVKSGMKLPANDKSKKKKVSLFHFCFVPSLCLFCAWLYCGLPAGRRMPKLAVSKAAEYQKVSCQSNSAISYSIRLASWLIVLQQIYINQTHYCPQMLHSVMEVP